MVIFSHPGRGVAEDPEISTLNLPFLCVKLSKLYFIALCYALCDDWMLFLILYYKPNLPIGTNKGAFKINSFLF